MTEIGVVLNRRRLSVIGRLSAVQNVTMLPLQAAASLANRFTPAILKSVICLCWSANRGWLLGHRRLPRPRQVWPTSRSMSPNVTASSKSCCCGWQISKRTKIPNARHCCAGQPSRAATRLCSRRCRKRAPRSKHSSLPKPSKIKPTLAMASIACWNCC